MKNGIRAESLAANGPWRHPPRVFILFHSKHNDFRIYYCIFIILEYGLKVAQTCLYTCIC